MRLPITIPWSSSLRAARPSPATPRPTASAGKVFDELQLGTGFVSRQFAYRIAVVSFPQLNKSKRIFPFNTGVRNWTPVFLYSGNKG